MATFRYYFPPSQGWSIVLEFLVFGRKRPDLIIENYHNRVYNTFVPEVAVELKSGKGKTREMFGSPFRDGERICLGSRLCSVSEIPHIATFGKGQFTLTSMEEDVLLGRIYTACFYEFDC